LTCAPAQARREQTNAITTVPKMRGPILLAGTSLPLPLRGSESLDINLLDPTEIHVEAVGDELLR